MSENTANTKKGTRLSSRILGLIVGAVICIVLLVFYGLTIGTNNTNHVKEAPVVHITASDNVYQELSNIPDSVPSGNKSPVVITDTPRIQEQNPREQSVVIANNNQTDYMKQLEAKMAQLKLQELQSAMNSSLTLQTANNSANIERTSSPPQVIADPAGKNLLNFPADKSDYQASNMQSDKNDFLNTAGKSTQIYSNETTTDQKYQYEVKAGTVIPAVLLTGINSDLPGQIIAKVRSNVFDSTTGKDVLIPQGSTLIGIYSSQISYGQSRCLMVWSRVIYPDGENLNLEGMPGADLEGYAGIEDEVNNHFWRVFGNAILMSIFTAGIELATQGFGNNNNNNNSNGYDASQIIAGALGMQLGEAGMAMVQKNMNIQPTIEIRPGNEFNILVTRDIAFKNHTLTNSKTMFRKFGIDITVYEKQDRLEAYLVTLFLVIFAGLISLICANFPIVNLSMNPYRITVTILLPLIYTAAYSYYLILHRETLKLFLAATSLGIMASSTLFVISVLYFDLADIFKNITMLSTFEKWSVLESYFTTYYVQFIPCLVFLFIANVLRISLRGKFNTKEKTSGVFGSAEFADRKYLLNNGFYDSSKTLFGKDDHDQYLYYPVCNRTIISMSGGGKTTGITIPALLTENRPVFVHDPKGELFEITANHRMQKFGREIILFDPFGVTGSSTNRSSINPFSYFPSDNQNYKDRFITSLTSAIVKSEGSPRYGSHFEDTAKIIIAGIIDMLTVQGETSFLNLYYIISEGPNAIKERIHSFITDNALNPDTLSPHLKEAWAILEATGKEETGSIFTTTLRQIRWLADSNLRGLFQKNTCDLRDFISGKADIFIVLPEDQIKEQSRVVRLILALTASLLIQTERTALSSKEYLFLLDELGQLGYNEELENYIEILRGRNCVFWSVFQTYSQIKLYQKPDLFINSKMLQLFSCSDPDIMQLIQKLGGKKTVLLESRSSSDSNNQQKLEYLKGSTSESTGTSHHEAATDLIQLNDIREMPFDEQLVFIQGMKPIKCKKTLYFKEECLIRLCGKS